MAKPLYKKDVNRAGGVLVGCFLLFPGLLILTVGLFLFSFFYSAQTLQCKKNKANQAQCQLSHSRVLKKEIKSFQLYGSKVERSSIRSRKPSYRILMSTNMGQIPLTDYYVGGDSIAEEYRINGEINFFIRDPRENHLKIQKDTRLGSFALGLIQLLVGVILTLLGGWMVYGSLSGKIY